MWNKAQPIRPLENEHGPLYYRTRPSPDRVRKFPVCDPRYQYTQLHLYHFVRQGYLPIQTPVADVWQLIEHDITNKNIMGSVIVNSVRYNPRLLVNTKAFYGVSYLFINPKDLEYGLEWQLSVWLYQFLKETGALRARREEESVEAYQELMRDKTEEALDEIAENPARIWAALFRIGIKWKEPDFQDFEKIPPELEVPNNRVWTTEEKSAPRPRDLTLHQ